MKILVAVKRVIDYREKVRIKPDGSGVETENVRMSMNPFDENAVEQAVSFKEAGKADEIVVVTIGNDKCADVLRSAMAMGADRAIHVKTDETVQPLAVAKILAAVAGNEKPDLILLGARAIDNDAGQVGPMLAGLMRIGQGCNVCGIELSDKHVTVLREVSGGIEKSEIPLPCVVTTDISLNKPRYAPLPAVLKARQKPLGVTTPVELGIDIAKRIKPVSVTPPPSRGECVFVSSVDELIDKLKNTVGVL